jgi:predicted ferric reductase
VAWQTLSPLAQDWPEWLGWLGLLLLMAGLASTFMPRLPYRRWRALHYLLGLGVLLGLAHLWAILGGSLGVLGAIGIALAALGWRLVVSDFGALARPYRVSAVRHPATDLVEVTLAPARRPWRPRPASSCWRRSATARVSMAAASSTPSRSAG